MSPRSSNGQNTSFLPAQVQPLLLLPLALCAVVMTVGPKLLVGALPVSIIGLVLIRVIEAVSARRAVVETQRPGKVWRPTPASVLLVALLGWAGLTILWSDRPEKSLEYWFDVSLMILFVVLALEVSARPLPDRLGHLIFSWGLIILTLTAGIMAVNLATDLPLLRALHDAGLITDQVTEPMLNRSLTFLVLLVWPFLAILTGRAPQLRAWVRGGALIGLTVAAILLGASAAALVAMVIGACGACGALAIPPKRLRQGLRAILVVTVLAGPWLLTHALPHARSAADAIPASAQHRIEILALYSFPLSERPLTGWGLLSATTVPKTPVPPEDADLFQHSDPLTMTVHPHNNFVQLWIDLGVPGILLVTALGWLAIDYIGRQASAAQRACATGACLSVLTVASTAYGVWQADWLAQVVLCVLLFRLSARGPRDASRSMRSGVG